MEMNLDIGDKKPIPEQDLEERIGKIATITKIILYDSSAKEILENSDLVKTVTIEIKNKSDVLSGNSVMFYYPEQFREFMDGYKISNPKELIGKPVISVYTLGWGQMLCGLIPLNFD